MFCVAQKGRQVGSGPSGQMKDQKLHAPVARSTYAKNTHCQSTFGSWDVQKVHTALARSTFQVKMCKMPQLRSRFGSWDAQKVHGVAARSTFRSTFRSQNVQKASAPEHFWKLRCWKSARRSGTKQIWQSKCTKRFRSIPLSIHLCAYLFVRQLLLQLQLPLPYTTSTVTLHYTYYTTLHYTTLQLQRRYTTLLWTTLPLQLQLITAKTC